MVKHGGIHFGAGESFRYFLNCDEGVEISEAGDLRVLTPVK